MEESLTSKPVWFCQCDCTCFKTNMWSLCKVTKPKCNWNCHTARGVTYIWNTTWNFKIANQLKTLKTKNQTNKKEGFLTWVLVKTINHLHITEKIFSDKKCSFLQAVSKLSQPQCNKRPQIRKELAQTSYEASLVGSIN